MAQPDNPQLQADYQPVKRLRAGKTLISFFKLTSVAYSSIDLDLSPFFCSVTVFSYLFLLAGDEAILEMKVDIRELISK